MQKPFYIVVGPEDAKKVREAAIGLAPRLDYRELAEMIDGTIVVGAPSAAKMPQVKPLAVLLSAVANTVMAFRQIGKIGHNSVVFSTGETWGLPYALAIRLSQRKGIRHYVYVHRVFSSNWRRFLRLMAQLLFVDIWLCVTKNQK